MDNKRKIIVIILSIIIASLIGIIIYLTIKKNNNRKYNNTTITTTKNVTTITTMSPEELENIGKNTFIMSIEKYATVAQSAYLSDANIGYNQGSGVYVYNIESDLGLPGVGDNVGYVVIDAREDKIEFYVFLHNDFYMIFNYPIIANGMPDKNNSNILAFDSDQWDMKASNEKKACEEAIPGVECKNREDHVIQ